MEDNPSCGVSTATTISRFRESSLFLHFSWCDFCGVYTSRIHIKRIAFAEALWEESFFPHLTDMILIVIIDFHYGLCYVHFLVILLIVLLLLLEACFILCHGMFCVNLW